METDDDWRNFCKAINHPEWIEDPRFIHIDNRLNNRQELDKLIADVTINYTPSDLAGILQKVKVAATPVLNIEEQYIDPQFIDRKTYVEIEHPLIGMELLPGVPFRLSKTPGEIRKPAPSLGEHNDYVLGDLLNLSQNEVEELIQQGVIY